MFRVSSSSVGQKSLSWVAATIDCDFESGEINLEVIFAGPESNEESINKQEDKEDPSLISDTESAIKGSLIIEISDDASNQDEEHVGPKTHHSSFDDD